MTSEEAAYIAGLFDGEGSINIKRGIEKKKKHKKALDIEKHTIRNQSETSGCLFACRK